MQHLGIKLPSLILLILFSCKKEPNLHSIKQDESRPCAICMVENKNGILFEIEAGDSIKTANINENDFELEFQNNKAQYTFDIFFYIYKLPPEWDWTLPLNTEKAISMVNQLQETVLDSNNNIVLSQKVTYSEKIFNNTKFQTCRIYTKDNYARLLRVKTQALFKNHYLYINSLIKIEGDTTSMIKNHYNLMKSINYVNCIQKKEKFMK